MSSMQLLKCGQCGYNCMNKKELKAHISRIHLTWFPYECEYCLSRWAVDTELIHHLQMQHPHLIHNVIRRFAVSDRNRLELKKLLAFSVFLSAQNTNATFPENLVSNVSNAGSNATGSFALQSNQTNGIISSCNVPPLLLSSNTPVNSSQIGYLPALVVSTSSQQSPPTMVTCESVVSNIAPSKSPQKTLHSVVEKIRNRTINCSDVNKSSKSPVRVARGRSAHKKRYRTNSAVESVLAINKSVASNPIGKPFQIRVRSQSTTPKKMYLCRLCQKSYRRTTTVFHAWGHVGNSLFCSLCDYGAKYNMKQSIIIHIKKHLPQQANIIDKREEMRAIFKEKMIACFPDVPRKMENST